MPINPARISADIEAIAAFSQAPPDVGYSRPTFSLEWRKAQEYVAAQAKSIGCNIRIDAAGNLHARPLHLSWTEPAWLSGSHIDSVPTGGKFDGVAGIVAPLEILRSAKQEQRLIPLELIIFAEEEGTTFGLGMLGSRAWVADLSIDQLSAIYNADGQNYLHAGAPHSVRPEALQSDKFNPSIYLGLIEIHIEQGPALWNANAPLAIVTAIAGRKQYQVTYQGVPNHAGSTSMADRRDALVAAADAIVQLEKIAKTLSNQSVATVGRITCGPNAVNVIPGEVAFTIDFRSPDDGLLSKGDIEIHQLIADCARNHGVKSEITMTENQPAIALNTNLCDGLKTAAGNVPTTVSGALHDAAIMAPHLPTAMIFVASRDGISHNPMEFSRAEDIAAAAQVLYNMIRS